MGCSSSKLAKEYPPDIVEMLASLDLNPETKLKVLDCICGQLGSTNRNDLEILLMEPAYSKQVLSLLPAAKKLAFRRLVDRVRLSRPSQTASELSVYSPEIVTFLNQLELNADENALILNKLCIELKAKTMGDVLVADTFEKVLSILPDGKKQKFRVLVDELKKEAMTSVDGNLNLAHRQLDNLDDALTVTKTILTVGTAIPGVGAVCNVLVKAIDNVQEIGDKAQDIVWATTTSTCQNDCEDI
jgi:hypothetical protein